MKYKSVGYYFVNKQKQLRRYGGEDAVVITYIKHLLSLIRLYCQVNDSTGAEGLNESLPSHG